MVFMEWFLLVPVAAGSLFSCLCLIAFRDFRSRSAIPEIVSEAVPPPVTILKPVCGLEKGLRENLRSCCMQDYPEFQIVCSVQAPSDPALPLLKEIERNFPDRVSLVIEDRRPGPNRKVGNLSGALTKARHDLLVISDSDIRLKPDYLKKITAPLSDPQVGYVCSLYRAVAAGRWFEKLEALTLNADFIPSVVFAYRTGSSPFCLGASVAFRKSDLDANGGIDALAGYLAEDYELGRRLSAAGKRFVLIPETVDTVIDLKSASHWWRHQVSWDQKTRAARPLGFAATVLVRAVPFALLFAFLKPDGAGLLVLGTAIAVRLSTAAWIIRKGLQDRESLVQKMVLLPIRDTIALISWAAALIKRRVVWRDTELVLMSGGRLAGGLSRE